MRERDRDGRRGEIDREIGEEEMTSKRARGMGREKKRGIDRGGERKRWLGTDRQTEREREGAYNDRGRASEKGWLVGADAVDQGSTVQQSTA